MNSTDDSAAASTAEEAAETLTNSRPYRLLVRGGLVAYGIVHLLVAYLAGRLALGQAAEDPSQTGAMRELASAPGGALLLIAVAVGLAAIAVWQFLFAALERSGTDREMWRNRFVGLGRGTLYITLALAAARAVVLPGADDGDAPESISAMLMEMPLGRVLVGAVGIGIVAVGISNIVKGVRGSYEKDLEGNLAGAGRWFAIIGHIAKGIAIGIVGLLFVWAAITYNAEEAGGLDAALEALRGAPFGTVLLLLAAGGLAAYGFYCFWWAKRPRFR